MTTSTDTGAEASAEAITARQLEVAERLVSKPQQAPLRFTWGTVLTYLLLTIGAVVWRRPLCG